MPPQAQLLDLHNHTRASYDACVTSADYERAHAAGRFDVVAITDHNRVCGARRLAERAPFQVIVGQEIDTAQGELIGLFLAEPVPPGLSALEAATRIRGQGGLVYLQHPFRRLGSRSLSRSARHELHGRGLIDVVEAANGAPFSALANRRAAAWARLAGLPPGAGSDAHEPSAIGSCLVRVPAGPVTAATLPELLRRGTIVERRRSAATLAEKVRWRTASAVRVRLGREPRRRRRPYRDDPR
jgi:predicted metal-dependent phosphoesterase TrpH